RSTPIPVAPRLAASITMRPSPEPRSITWSPFFTSAMRSIRSTISIGVFTYGTVPSSQAQDCGCACAGAARTRAQASNLAASMRRFIPFACRYPMVPSDPPRYAEGRRMIRSLPIVLGLALVTACATTEYRIMSTDPLKNESGHVVGHKERLRDVKTGEEFEQI